MVKNPPAMSEMQVQSLGQEDSLDEGHDNSLQYSCPENTMDKEPGRLQSIGWQRAGHD